MIKVIIMEHRQFHRLSLQVDITYYLKSDKKSGNSWTKNIGIGGICITTYTTPLILNEVYILIFSLPGTKKRIKTEGLVVCSREYIEGIAVFYDNGIKFLKLHKNDKDLLEDFSIGTINL